MILAFGAFEVDPKRRTLTCQGKRVPLLSRPFDILLFLIVARDRVVSREEMQTAIWPAQIVTSNNINVQVSALRRVLAQHDAAEMIITVPGRGYRFIGEVVERAGPAPVPQTDPGAAPGGDPAPMPSHPPSISRPWIGPRSAAIAIACLAAAAVGAAALLSRPSGDSFPVRVRVEAVPDTVGMAPESYCRVDYVFHVLDPTDLQLATEDVSVSLVSGELISSPSLGGRIYHGSFPIRGRTTGVYHNNLYLPAWLAASVRAMHRDEFYMRHNFHLIDPHGTEIIAPAVVKIVIGSRNEPCAAQNGN
jgi:DNA-binding winged helix-turn-helix (wHTH) protein